MKYPVVAHGLSYRKALSNDKIFENMCPTIQDNRLSA